MNTKRSKILKYSFLMLLITVPAVGWTQRWNIYDSLRLRNYVPSNRVVQLASDTTMNDRARKLFYVYHPQLNNKEEFNSNCNASERTIVLGCYISGMGIYVYDVSDERLRGIVEVTAAHEMLHAAYDRLGGAEKAQVDSMLDNAYKSLTDQRIRDTIEDYRKNGADTTNELHSILGTEVRVLPPELDIYYKKYFNDRLVTVGFSEKYEAAFSGRKTQAEQYLSQMDELKTQINQLNASLSQESSQLESQFASLQARRSQTKDAASFNAEVDQYNNQVAAYNVKVRRTASLIDQHNDILEKYNAIALEERELVQSIDSRPNTIDTQ